MPAVGTRVRERVAPLARSNPTDTGKLFIAGAAERGSHTKAHLVTSMTEFERKLGARITTSLLWDYLDAHFRNGGRAAYVGRVVGPAPTIATVNLNDNAAAVSLVGTAKGPGAFYAALNAIVLTSVDDPGMSAGQYKIQITHDTLGILETSPVFTTRDEAVAWSETSEYIGWTPGASSLIPVRVASPGTSLTASTDDATNINDTTRNNALALFTKDLGAGQVAYANGTSATAHGQLLDHCAAMDGIRVALCDPPDVTTKTSLLSAASSVRTHPNARYGAMFAPWVRIPGLIPNNPRSVPASAIVSGVIARNDGNDVSPNQPSAADLGEASYALDVKATFTVEADRSDLNEGSVNLMVLANGVVKAYGYRSLVSKVANPNWWMFGNVRFYMLLASLSYRILEGYVLKEIDAERLLFKKLEGELQGMLEPFVPNSLWDYFVDTDTVNTDTTIAEGELHATIEVVMSPHAEVVILDIVKRQIV